MIIVAITLDGGNTSSHKSTNGNVIGIFYVRRTPLRLLDSCRVAVRTALGERLMHCAPRLPLPPLLQRSLLLVDDVMPMPEYLAYCGVPPHIADLHQD